MVVGSAVVVVATAPCSLLPPAEQAAPATRVATTRRRVKWSRDIAFHGTGGRRGVRVAWAVDTAP
jgi:hypothetical protein